MVRRNTPENVRWHGCCRNAQERASAPRGRKCGRTIGGRLIVDSPFWCIGHLSTACPHPCPQGYPQLMHRLTHSISTNLSTASRSDCCMAQTGECERESFSFVVGSRAIAKVLGLAHRTAARRCTDRLLPAVKLGGRWHMALAAVRPYQLELARLLLRREHSLTQPVVAPQQCPGGGGVVPAGGADGSTPARCKKVSPKRFDEEVVILE
jgi:hypothetical protein